MIKFNKKSIESINKDIQISRVIEAQEQKKRDVFKGFAVTVPWYLTPFRKVIREVAYLSFKYGLSCKGNDSVSINRPSGY